MLNDSACVCWLAKFTFASVYAGHVEAAFCQLIVLHQLWLRVWYEGHLIRVSS